MIYGWDDETYVSLAFDFGAVGKDILKGAGKVTQQYKLRDFINLPEVDPSIARKYNTISSQVKSGIDARRKAQEARLTADAKEAKNFKMSLGLPPIPQDVGGVPTEYLLAGGGAILLLLMLRK